MNNSKYVKFIREVIENKAKLDEGGWRRDKEFYDGLLPDVKSVLTPVFPIFGLAPVDDNTFNSYFHTAMNEFLSVVGLKQELPSTLKGKDLESWLTEERLESMQWPYTNRYLSYLEEQGRTTDMIKETRISSLDILGKMGDPKSTRDFYIKGLVVGAVQSGKTGNFNAVINRAIDSGYRLIIVLSGIMEDLRKQTQQRIESDVVGLGKKSEPGKKGKKGVGNKKSFGALPEELINQVNMITSYDSDFDRPLLRTDCNLYGNNILVCKKNVSILRNILIWLDEWRDEDQLHDIPLLILDDEADNASLNNLGAKGSDYASTINGYIRAILAMFSQKTYLGYTATPFANVLQDRNNQPTKRWEIKYRVKKEKVEKHFNQVDNIFPDHFIVLLNPPSNYVGAKQIFETLTPLDNKIGEKIPLYSVVKDVQEDFPLRVWQQRDGSLMPVERFANRSIWDEKVGPFGSYMEFDSFNEYRKATRAAKADDNFPIKIPQSLKNAIMCFVLALAVREHRKPMMIGSPLHQIHSSMLIHVSRFTKWQNTTETLVSQFVDELTARINGDMPNEPGSIYKALEQVWNKHYAQIIESIDGYLPEEYSDPFMTKVVYSTIKELLPDAIADISVKAVNNVTKETLDYPKNRPLKVIAIGGNRLSRGFTLEGLVINYFVRSTDYSDTLLQMGRWFGYRPGYLDLCKVFTTQDAIDKFDSTTLCIEELENDFRSMERYNKTPEEFMLKVKQHPGTLQITRQPIMKNTRTIRGSYQDKLEMTTEFDIRAKKIEAVWLAFREKLAPQFKDATIEKDMLVITLIGEEIIEFLSIESNLAKTTRLQMIEYIKECQSQGKLTDWTVAVKLKGNAKRDGKKSNLSQSESNLPQDVQLSIRRGPKTEEHVNKFLEEYTFKAMGRSANIMSSAKDFSIALNSAEEARAEDAFRQYHKKLFINKEGLDPDAAEQKAAQKTLPERIYRERMKESQGILVIYLFDSYYSFNCDPEGEQTKYGSRFTEFVDTENINLNIPLVGYAIGIPPIENDISGFYAQSIHQFNKNDELGDDEDEFADEQDGVADHLSTSTD